MEKKTMITTSEKWGFLGFSMSSNIVFNFKSLYYLIFLTNILKIPVLTAGTILTLGTIWDAINDPLIGIWTANHTFKNGEKIRPFALWWAVPWAITVILMFCDFKTSQTLTIIICILIYFIFEALYTGLCMPYNSMGSLASNIDEDRKAINAYRSLGSCIGSGIGAVAVTPLVKLFGGLKGEGAIIGAGDAPALFKTACFMSVICVIGCFWHYFTTKERIKQTADDDEKISLLTAYKMLFKCKSWIYNMLYIIGYGIISALVMGTINYYAAYILGSSALATPLLAIYLVMAIVLSIFTPTIDSKIGRKKTMILGAVVMIVGMVIFMIQPHSIITIGINAFTFGIGLTICFVMFNTNRNNIADIVEWQSGRRIDSMVAAGDNLASKLAEALAVELMAMSLHSAGFNEALGANQTPETLSTICALLGWVPGIIAILMIIVLLKMDIVKEYDDTKKQFEVSK